MTTASQALVATAILAVALIAPYSIAMLRHWGIRAVLGNRDKPAPLPKWAIRPIRAHRNMLENLAPFATIVLAAQLAGVSSEHTVWGVTVFFWARVAHAITYIAGIPYLRTAAFTVSLVAMFDLARLAASAGG